MLCMILKIFSPNFFGEKIGVFLLKTKLNYAKKLIIILGFEKNTIFCRKLSKIAENCDHNIDPRSRVARFFLVHDTETGKTVPNEHNMFRMVTKYPKYS
jgi:hypothetical protein